MIDLTKQNGKTDKLIRKLTTPELVTMIKNCYSVPRDEALKMLEGYKERYKFDKCPSCGAYAVHYHSTGLGFEFVADNDCRWNTQNNTFYKGESLDEIESYQPDLSFWAHICMACDCLVNTGTDYDFKEFKNE